MNPSARIQKRRAPQRRLRDPNQSLSVSRRRSSRLRSRQLGSIPHVLGSVYERQNALEQRSTDPQTSQPVGATSYTRVPSSGLIEESAPGPSRAQFQEYLCPPQTHTLQTRKRRPDRSIETGAERPPKRARLTEKNLNAWERMAGRGKKDPKSKSSQSRKSSRSELDSSRSDAQSNPSATSEASTKTISSTDSRFPAQIARNGILEQPNSKKPANYDHLQERLDRARETASPTESEYQLAAYKIQTAENEQTVLLETSALLKGYERGYRRAYNHPFSDFPKNVGLNNGLSSAQPDMVEGLDLTQFDLFPIREDSSLEAAVPSSGPNAVTLPHLAGEWKGPGKDMKLAQHQAAYDAACMVYGRSEACSFLGSPDPTGHAYVQTFTTDGTTLNTFAHYSTESQGQVKYHQFPTSSSFVISSYEDHKTSRRRLRNLQDDAKEISENLRDKLNEKWSANQHQPPASTSVPAATVDQHQPPAPTSLPADTVDVRDDGYDSDDPGCQLLTETGYYTRFDDQDGYNPPDTQQPLSSNVEFNPTDTVLGYDPTDGPQVLTTDDGYSSDTLHAQNYDPPVTPPYSSENVSPSLESHEDVDNSNTRGHRRTRRSRVPTDNSKARKTRRRH